MVYHQTMKTTYNNNNNIVLTNFFNLQNISRGTNFVY